ncbi:MAG: hypothetical protein KI792_12710 [Alphaproteobacteria bacterium]|nr:hypothetical protein [Alphaproteobacteria bacterium SS10]
MELAQSTCANILDTARDITSGDRAATYGDKVENHANIARLWNAHLHNRGLLRADIPGSVVAELMGLMKFARMAGPLHHPDNYVDGVGYIAIAGECRAREEVLKADKQASAK